VIIIRLDDEGPAANAGLEVGDLLLSFNGETVSDVRALTRIVADAGVDATVDVELVRDRRARTIEVTLGELETGREDKTQEALPELAVTDNALGVEFAPLDEATRRRYSVPSDIDGVVINSVSPRGPSFGNLEKGDVILEMAFDPVLTVADAMEEMEEAVAQPETPLLLQVWRGGRGGYKVFFSIQLDVTS
ncbi:MAG: PDZ domain-containing protein, partial [Pseudomonadota bacterium]